MGTTHVTLKNVATYYTLHYTGTFVLVQGLGKSVEAREQEYQIKCSEEKKRCEAQNTRHTFCIISARRQVLQLQLLRQNGQLFTKSLSVKCGYLFSSCNQQAMQFC
jgi:hypothetical protein